MEYRRRTVAGIDWGGRRRLPSVATASCPNGVDQLDYNYDNDDSVNNNSYKKYSGSASASVNANMNDTTMLVDELEQLRTDNFQLRLRVYNAERRVDRLSASAARSRVHGSDSDTGSSSGCSASDDEDDRDARELAAAKATAGAAVRTVHDLLTVNRRLLSLLAAAVSAKAVTVTPDDKRRWQKLRNRVEDCGAVPPQIEEDEELENGDSNDNGSVSSEDSETARRLELDAIEERATESTLRRVPLGSPPPPPLEPDVAGGGNGSELVRLRARCRRLERSLQQLVNTELWARNRQIGKLEQQRYVTQVQAQKERRSAAVTSQQSAPVQTVTKGILVRKSPPQSPPVKEPVLPDYSEVNFFYSCDEDDDDDDDEDNNDDDDDRENYSETNGLSSTEEETQSGNDPVKLPAPLASSSPQIVGSQKRQRRRRRPKNDAVRTAVSSSTESASVQAVGDLSSGATTATPTPSRRRHRVTGSRRRRLCERRLDSICGRCAGDADRRCSPTADAQVQCDGTGAEDGGDQAGLLRRELEVRRRENCRLYDMLLRLQRDRDPKTAVLPEDHAVAEPDRDDDGSPEPYGRAARAVRGRIADLLPPLLRTSAEPTARTDDDDEQTLLRLQQQQQLLLLARLRERIVAYERQELLGAGGGGGDCAMDAASSALADQENAVKHMDRAALVNVALPRAVDRLRRALVPLLQHKQQEKRSPPPLPMENGRAAAERDSSVG